MIYSRFGGQTWTAVSYRYETIQMTQEGSIRDFAVPSIVPSSRRAYIFLGNLRQLKKAASFWKWLVKEEKFDV